jgi:hypothetical protein
VFGFLVDGAGDVERTPAVSTGCSVQLRVDLNLLPHVARGPTSHVSWRWRGPARALGTLTDLDRVREHDSNAIEPRDQVARSGWVGFRH